MVLIDDSDFSILYSGDWTAASGNQSPEQYGTTHGSRIAGSRAIVPFIGRQITVFGTVSDTSFFPDPPVSSYSVDGSDNPVNYTATVGTKVAYRVPFYRSPQLANGQHTLVITNLVTQPPLWLDYFEVVLDAPQSTPTQDAATPAERLTGFVTSTFAAAPPHDSAPASPQSCTRRMIPAVIAGTVVGAAAITLVALLLVWRSYRRQRKPNRTVTPFLSNAPSALPTTHPSSRTRQPEAASIRDLLDSSPSDRDRHLYSIGAGVNITNSQKTLPSHSVITFLSSGSNSSASSGLDRKTSSNRGGYGDLPPDYRSV